eukprot:9778953-Alexandrium_andersonii.AAC.1
MQLYRAACGHDAHLLTAMSQLGRAERLKRLNIRKTDTEFFDSLPPAQRTSADAWGQAPLKKFAH